MKKITSYIDFGKPYLFFLLLLVASLPFSRFGMSVAQFSILGLWFLEGEFKQKISDLTKSKAALILISFYFLHLLGLLYTSDFDHGLKDIRIKLPLLFLPIAFVTSEKLRKQNIFLILKVYLAAVMVSTLYSLYLRLTTDISDFRELSPLISHIRLSLNVCLALFFAMYFATIRYTGRIVFQLLFYGTALWFLFFLVMIESATGILILITAGFIIVLYGLLKSQNKYIKKLAFAFVILMPLTLVVYLNYTIKQYFKPQDPTTHQLDKLTMNGNPYWHDTIHQPIENGNWIGLYICENELRDSWNQRSSLAFDGKDEKGQELKYTLFRYMNSKGLRKDAQGMKAMDEKDIRNVELGIANYVYTRKFSLKSRLYKIFWEYQIKQRGLNPGGHSVIQRLEYWKAAMGIISNNFVFGVGTGDVKIAFKQEYKSSHSVLDPRYQHRAHNQFMTVFVAFGVIGFIWFIIFMVYPALIQKKLFTYQYFVFWITMVISMLVEDSLETQVGVTLFAFFNAFLLFAEDNSKKLPN